MHMNGATGWYQQIIQRYQYGARKYEDSSTNIHINKWYKYINMVHEFIEDRLATCEI